MPELVRQARSEGMSWQAIGDVFGTSRQAVQQRFGRHLHDRVEKTAPQPRGWTARNPANRAAAAWRSS